MARRISSKARLQKLQEEKAVEADEKKETAAKKKAAPKKKAAAKKKAPRKKAASAGRMKVVWTVGEPGKAAAKEFPFPEKDAADAEAARLTKKHGKTFIVKRDRVAME